MSPHIQTYRGEMVPLHAPLPAHIHLPDIAHALARIPRFNGHTLRPWSVADHSLLVLELMPEDCFTPDQRLAGLLHDAHEAYLGDIATPIAIALRAGKDAGALEGLKVNFDVVIAKALGLDPGLFHHPAVAEADRQALALEVHHLMAKPTQPWPELPPLPTPAPALPQRFWTEARDLLLTHAATLLAARAGIEIWKLQLTLAPLPVSNAEHAASEALAELRSALESPADV